MSERLPNQDRADKLAAVYLVQEPKPKPHLRLTADESCRIIDSVKKAILPKYKKLLDIVAQFPRTLVQQIHDDPGTNSILLEWGEIINPDSEMIDLAIEEFKGRLPKRKKRKTDMISDPIILENYAYISTFIEPESDTVEVISRETTSTWLRIPEFLEDPNRIDPYFSRALANPLPGMKACRLKPEEIELGVLRDLPGWLYPELVVGKIGWDDVDILKKHLPHSDEERVLP